MTNWPAYDRGLVQRGDVTVWLSSEAIDAWRAQPTGKRGEQPKFSDLAIAAALTLRLVFRLPLCQAKGFVRSVFGLMDVALEVPDHTTLSRRSKQLRIDLRRNRREGRIHLVIDSSGLSIVDGDVGSITADDTVAMYEAGARRGARVIAPPSRTASVSRRKPRSRARDRTIRRVEKLGRRRWKKAFGYHRQGTVENAFFRYKTIIGDRLRPRTSETQATEARLACEILNRMTALGRPKSVAIKS